MTVTAAQSYNYESLEVKKPTISALIDFDSALVLLNISKATLYKLVSQRLIGHVRIYKKILFKEEHIKEYLAVHEICAIKKGVPPIEKTQIKNINDYSGKKGRGCKRAAITGSNRPA